MTERTFLKELIDTPLKISKFHFDEISPILHNIKSILQYENLLVFNQRLLSIFSAANYRGSYFPNPASYAIIKSNEIILRNLIIS